MSSRSATAIIVTSDSCGTCKTFERYGKRDQLVAAINSLPNVEAQVIKVPDLTQKSMADLKRYHPDLPKFVAWFPTLILANETWHNHSSKLEGVVYGGTLIDGRLAPTAGFGLNWFESGKVKNWIPAEIKQNRMFTSSSTQPHPNRVTNNNVMDNGRSSNVMDNGRSSNVMDNGRSSNVMDNGMNSNVMNNGRSSNVMDNSMNSNVMNNGRSNNHNMRLNHNGMSSPNNRMGDSFKPKYVYVGDDNDAKFKAW